MTFQVRMTYSCPERMAPTRDEFGRVSPARIPDHPKRPARAWEVNGWWEDVDHNSARGLFDGGATMRLNGEIRPGSCWFDITGRRNTSRWITVNPDGSFALKVPGPCPKVVSRVWFRSLRSQKEFDAGWLPSEIVSDHPHNRFEKKSGFEYRWGTELEGECDSHAAALVATGAEVRKQ